MKSYSVVLQMKLNSIEWSKARCEGIQSLVVHLICYQILTV